MYTNVNLAAPIGAVVFLGTGLLLLILCLALAYGIARKKFVLIRVALVCIGLLLCAYFFMMLVLSASGSTQVVARGGEKHFCEIDCHLAYSIQDVQQMKTVGHSSANGIYYVVTIKTRFDETTISRTRGDFPLHPNSRLLAVLDAEGHSYPPSPEGQRALEGSGGAGSSITTPLRPGESYTSVFAFDLPATINGPVLLIREGAWLTHFLIGHENSLAHKKTFLQI